jgi:hypothetical protein
MSNRNWLILHVFALWGVILDCGAVWGLCGYTDRSGRQIIVELLRLLVRWILTRRRLRLSALRYWPCVRRRTLLGRRSNIAYRRRTLHGVGRLLRILPVGIYSLLAVIRIAGRGGVALVWLSIRVWALLITLLYCLVWLLSLKLLIVELIRTASIPNTETSRSKNRLQNTLSKACGRY